MNDEKIINAIKAISIAEISKAQSSHPGIALGAAPILYTLYNKHMNIDVTDDKWINRDRFVMSAGHAQRFYMLHFTCQDLIYQLMI